MSEKGSDLNSRDVLLKDSLLRIRELRSKVEQLERGRSEPVAIVGLGCRFPGGANSPEEFWKLVSEGRSAVTEIPPDRWAIDDYYDPDPNVAGKMSTRFGAFLDGIDRFDAAFFGISPVEADSMDPQQRLLLEVCWQALEDAGIAADGLMGSSTGVFVGLGSNDYALLRSRSTKPEDIDPYLALGTVHSVVAGRIAYVLGLQGPCMAIDTACSSSLVAVHQAVRSLRAGECQLALAGGVSAILTPDYFINFSKAGMLATDGRCKTFDAEADGYVRGDGCGVVILKTLSNAVHDGDRILAIIRGSAINQDGRSSGLTVPNGLAQEAVIRAALADARLSPTAVDYVEAHGTGTSLGDPIEVHALGSALCESRTQAQPLRIASVKTNIGHLEAAAGMAGLIKTVLSLKHDTLPAQLHFKTPNPQVSWSKWPIEVVTSDTPWPRGERPRVAGISSFGFSGTNAHIVVEEPPKEEKRETESSIAIVTFSGKTADARRAVAEGLAQQLAECSELRLGDVAHTRNVGRSHESFRAAVIAESCMELEESLRAFAEGRQDPRTRSGLALTGDSPEVVFLFTGQGAQYPDMGRQLYESLDVFHSEIDRCASILSGELDRPLLELLYGDSRNKIYDTIYAQPATFAFEYALAAQWKSWGITPAAALGHSLGEYAAACVAGVLRLEDALKLVAVRGRLMHSLPRGAMAAVFTSEYRVTESLDGFPSVSIASVNSPENVVISGDEREVALFCEKFTARGYTCKPIRISQAAHSHLVDSMLDPLEEAARNVQMREPELELVSNVTGASVLKGQINPVYWRNHARSQVRFSQGLLGLYERGYRVFLEIGPRPTLTGFVAETLPADGLCAVASLRPEVDARREMLDGLGLLYCAGVPVAWHELDRGCDHRTVSLPTYPFERERFWFTSAPSVAQTSREPLFETCWRKTRLQSEQAPFDLSPQTFARKWAILGRLTHAYQARALAGLGAFGKAGDSYDSDSLCRIFGIAPTYTRLMRRWMDHLAELGTLSREGSVFRADTPLLPLELEPLLRESEEEFKDYPEFFDYVQSCGPRLASVLTGAESPLDTLFPEGSFELADGLYHRSAVSRYLNSMVRAALESAEQSLPANRRLQVLEIGAGTGGTTAAVLPWLNENKTSYTFTDVSELFLSRAQEKFSQYPFVRYCSLDVDRDLTEQGFPGDSFDVIVAANVLHATRDLNATIARVAALLRGGGILILSETTAHPAVFDITTGLIEGWQIFEDASRGDNPLVSAKVWVELLTKGGFETAMAFPEEGSPASALGNHVIIAGRPGSALALLATVATTSRAQPKMAGKSSTIAKADRLSIVEELQNALPAERSERLAEVTRDAVMQILRLDEKRKPSLRDRLMALGFDSLMAVQLRNCLGGLVGKDIRLPATLVFDHPTCEAIGAYLSQLIWNSNAGEETRDSSRESSRALAAAAAASIPIEELSEDEAELALIQRLNQIERNQR